ncbi:MAG TPA: GDP-L-fucose synthase [candidate division Zixibacteria bacterium]|nr:GDP-L-fucose synthase [candidate division Zixibacteria bacterium]
MRVLLTGSNGMVGRNVLEQSRAGSVEVIAPSRRELNLLDAGAVSSFMQRVRPEAVFHTAGTVGGIQANMREMSRFMVENADMGRNVILGALRAGVKKLVNLGSSCMYPRDHDGVLTEDMLLAGELEPTNEGYAIAKNFSARLCHYLNRENPGLMYRTLIPCNLYGRWDHYNDLERSHLMAALVTKVEKAIETGAREVTIWGTGTVRREFLYAGDLADCIWWTLENIEHVPDFANCGTGVDATVTEYYETVAKAAGFTGRFVYDSTKPDGMKRKLMDVSKLRALGWTAKTDLRQGIAKTIEFFREHTAVVAVKNG